jgi:hypothetical protein
MNQAVELHDSVLERVTEASHGIVLRVAAYVHRSSGVPGVDPGTGWSQPAEMTVLAGRVVARTGSPPFSLAGGTLVVEGREIENVLPVPSSHAGPVQVRLEGAEGEQLVIVGEGLQLVVLDEPEYLEEFGGSGAVER